MWSAMLAIRHVPYKKNNVTHIKLSLDLLLVESLQHRCGFKQNNNLET